MAVLRVEEFIPDDEYEPYLIARLVAGKYEFVLDQTDDTIPDMEGPEAGEKFIAEMKKVAEAIGISLLVDASVKASLEELRHPEEPET